MTTQRLRVVPVLLLDGGQLWKTRRFKNKRYVGDPLNVTRILNDKEVDELVVLDVSATREARAPDIGLLRGLAEECYMPLCYGGGVRTLEDAAALLAAGMEKISLGAVVVDDPPFVTALAGQAGSQAVVVAVDVAPGSAGRHTAFVRNGRVDTGLTAVEHARRAVDLGAGELLVTSIPSEGMRRGYDLDCVGAIAQAVPVPVIAHGGARGMDDFAAAADAGASAAAAGSTLVFTGPWDAVLVTYPDHAARVAKLGGRGAR